MRGAIAALMAMILAGYHAPAKAIDEFEDLRFISTLPRTQREVELAFSRSKSDACEFIAAGQPLEMQSFAISLTERDRIDNRDRRPLASSRRDLFSVGLEFEALDREALPIVSRSSIVDYLEKHFVMIQARIRRDLLDRKLYFHHRPLALTAQYRGSRLTTDFEPLVANSIREFHSLGLYLPEGTRIKLAEKLRTIVLLFRVPLLTPGSNRVRDSYEFVFIHGREIEGSDAEDLQYHIFVTTNDRTRLEYLQPSRRPSSPRLCSVLGRIAVTEFDSNGIYPKSSATRSYRLADQAEFEWAKVDEYCASQGLDGGLSSNLVSVLEAIVDGRLKPAQSQ